MQQYKDNFHKRVKPEAPLSQKTLPINKGQEALSKATFASMEKETFFNDAYGEILSDLFTQWLKTASHEKEYREYLYATAMALGSVKEKLIQIETYGKNVPHIEKLTPTFKDEGSEEAL